MRDYDEDTLYSPTLDLLALVPQPERRVMVEDVYDRCRNRAVATLASSLSGSVVQLGKAGGCRVLTRLAVLLAEVWPT